MVGLLAQQRVSLPGCAPSVRMSASRASIKPLASLSASKLVLQPVVSCPPLP